MIFISSRLAVQLSFSFLFIVCTLFCIFCSGLRWTYWCRCILLFCRTLVNNRIDFLKIDKIVFFGIWSFGFPSYPIICGPTLLFLVRISVEKGVIFAQMFWCENGLLCLNNLRSGQPLLSLFPSSVGCIWAPRPEGWYVCFSSSSSHMRSDKYSICFATVFDRDVYGSGSQKIFKVKDYGLVSIIASNVFQKIFLV